MVDRKEQDDFIFSIPLRDEKAHDIVFNDIP